MKTLKLLIAAFFLGLLTFYNAEAQTVSTKLDDFQYYVWDSDSPELGLLTSIGTIHVLNEKYDLFGNLVGEKFNCHTTTLTSSITGEVFLANFVTHTSNTSDPDVFVLTVKSVLIGNMGTRIVCTEKAEYNISTGEFVSLEHRHKQW